MPIVFKFFLFFSFVESLNFQTSSVYIDCVRVFPVFSLQTIPENSNMMDINIQDSVFIKMD